MIFGGHDNAIGPMALDLGADKYPVVLDWKHLETFGNN